MATKRSHTSIGAHFDPALAFEEDRWSRGAQWIHALPDSWSYLLICALVERVALPIYIKERPKNKTGAAQIREAIEMGRRMADGRSVDRADLDAMQQQLQDRLRQEDQYIATLPPRPNTMEYSSAKMCVYAANYCVQTTPQINPVESYIGYAADYSLRGDAKYDAKRKAYQDKVDEIAREFIRLAFQEAELYAHEEDYPTLSAPENDRGFASITLATLYRNNMIQLIRRIRATGVSNLIDAKLSSADQMMHNFDYASVYLTNRGVKPSMWKKSTIDDKAAMAAFQVLLNNNKEFHVGLVVRELNTVPRADIYVKGISVVGGFVDVTALLGDPEYPYGHLGGAFHFLNVKDQRLFLADCADHVQVNFDLTEPMFKDLPKESIQAARDYANGLITELQMFTVGESLFDRLRPIEREAREIFFDVMGDGEPQRFLYKYEWNDAFGTDPRLRYWAALSAADTTRHNDQLFLMDAAKSASSMGEDEKEFEWQKKVLLKYVREAYDQAMRLYNDLPILTGKDLPVLQATLLRAEALENLKKIKHPSVREAVLAQIAEATDSSFWLNSREEGVKDSLLEVLIFRRKRNNQHLLDYMHKAYLRFKKKGAR